MQTCSRQIEAEPNSGLDDMADIRLITAAVLLANHQSMAARALSCRANYPIGQDALVRSWPDIILYAFPPIPFLLPAVLFVMALYIFVPSSTGAPPVACLAPDGW